MRLDLRSLTKPSALPMHAMRRKTNWQKDVGMTETERRRETDVGRIVLGAAGLAAVATTASATATVRRNFSPRHLHAAEHFAEQVRIHEEKHAGAGWGPHFDFCDWNVSAAIILSFSAIEAALDEAEDDLKLPPELVDALGRVSALDHAQALLAHRGCSTLGKGVEPYQSADLLRALRNGLVHPKAEWDNARHRNKQLSRKILGSGLELSPFQKDPELAFPHGCMSAAVAKWAAATARLFIREVRLRLGLRRTV